MASSCLYSHLKLLQHIQGQMLIDSKHFLWFNTYIEVFKLYNLILIVQNYINTVSDNNYIDLCDTDNIDSSCEEKWDNII